MTRVNLLLLLALIASSMYLVRVSYDSRRLFTEVHRAQSEERRLATDFERLKAEAQAQATPLRVEKTAREKLAMRSATPAVTHYVTQSAGAASAAVSPDAALPAVGAASAGGAP